MLEGPFRLPLGDLWMLLGIEPERRQPLRMPLHAPPEINAIRFPEWAMDRSDEHVGRDGPRRGHSVELFLRDRRQKVDRERPSHRRRPRRREFERDLSWTARFRLDAKAQVMLAVGGSDPHRLLGCRAHELHARGEHERRGHVRIARPVVDDGSRQVDGPARAANGRISEEAADHEPRLGGGDSRQRGPQNERSRHGPAGPGPGDHHCGNGTMSPSDALHGSSIVSPAKIRHEPGVFGNIFGRNQQRTGSLRR